MKKIKSLLLIIMAIFVCSFGSLVSCTDDKDYTEEALKAVHGAWVTTSSAGIWGPDAHTHEYNNGTKCGYYFDSDGYVYNIIDGEITDSKMKYTFNRAWGEEGKAVSLYIFELEFTNGGVTELWLDIQENSLGHYGMDSFLFDETITR